jgi:hypothetical protein
MTNRELLEAAAKAAGIELESVVEDGTDAGKGVTRLGYWWAPLHDDGDALRLAVKLGISTLPYPVYNEGARHSVIAKQRRKSDTLREANPTEVIELYGDDPYAATRRAIVRAAAEIGKEME